MNSPNFDNSGDNEPWDGKGELEWTERNWKQFLRDADEEVGRFVKIYQSLKDDPQRLDHTALGMGWDSDEWSIDLEYDNDDSLDWMNESLEEDDDGFEDIDDDDPYTIHKHPLYVTSRALYALLSHYWKVIVQEIPGCVDVADAVSFGESVRIGESNAIMGIHALEMGDYNLVVVHLQRSLYSLNETLRLFQKAANHEAHPLNPSIIEDFQAFFFDLREVWLRVIKECRGSSESY